MSNYIYIATSLDGYIADANNGIGWLEEIPNPDHGDFGFADFMSGVDGIVMGRNTFATVLTFDSWPYEKPVFVLSRSLTSLPESTAGKAEIVSGDLRDLVEQLNGRGFRNLYIDGGQTIQSFLAEDLIDEMIITRVPVLLGGGVPLFGRLSQTLHFDHKRTETLNEVLTKSYYQRTRP